MTKDREEDPVIYAPEKRSSLLGIIEKILAVIFTVLLWCFLLFYIYSRLFQTESMERTTSMMEFLLLAVGVIFLVEFGWQFYNWFLFHGKDRRREFPAQSLQEVGRLYGITEHHMEELLLVQHMAVVRYEDNKYYYCIEGREPIEIVMLREAK